MSLLPYLSKRFLDLKCIWPPAPLTLLSPFPKHRARCESFFSTLHIVDVRASLSQLTVANGKGLASFPFFRAGRQSHTHRHTCAHTHLHLSIQAHVHDAHTQYILMTPCTYISTHIHTMHWDGHLVVEVTWKQMGPRWVLLLGSQLWLPVSVFSSWQPELKAARPVAPALSLGESYW
jgi:hypothetical protein